MIQGLNIAANDTDMQLVPLATESPHRSNFHANQRALQPTAISDVNRPNLPTAMSLLVNHPVDEERKDACAILIRENNQLAATTTNALNSVDDMEIDHEVEEEFKRLTQATPIQSVAQRKGVMASAVIGKHSDIYQ